MAARKIGTPPIATAARKAAIRATSGAPTSVRTSPRAKDNAEAKTESALGVRQNRSLSTSSVRAPLRRLGVGLPCHRGERGLLCRPGGLAAVVRAAARVVGPALRLFRPLGFLTQDGEHLLRTIHVPTFSPTRGVPSTAARSEAPSSESEYMTSLPSLLERTRPCDLNCLRWCETRFCERPAIQERSQTHSSPPSPASRKAAASVRRVGSESALARSAAPRAASSPSSLPRIASARGASMQIRSQRSSVIRTLQHPLIC